MFDEESKDVRLIDFGHSMQVVDIQNTRITGQHGNFKYFAPEVIDKEPYNYQVDWYAFGVVLYQLIRRKVIWEVFTGIRNTIKAECMARGLEIILDCTETVDKRVTNSKELERSSFFKNFDFNLIEKKEKN